MDSPMISENLLEFLYILLFLLFQFFPDIQALVTVLCVIFVVLFYLVQTCAFLHQLSHDVVYFVFQHFISPHSYR